LDKVARDKRIEPVNILAVERSQPLIPQPGDERTIPHEILLLVARLIHPTLTGVRVLSLKGNSIHLRGPILRDYASYADAVKGNDEVG